ncbi:hypothetical protein NFI96_020393 [Prochilodus magdalenae]|nr:hypothetical protein NFI96_020393 [Prochilodus magdalenae]
MSFPDESSTGQKDKPNRRRMTDIGTVASVRSETAQKPLNAASATYGRAHPPGMYGMSHFADPLSVLYSMCRSQLLRSPGGNLGLLSCWKPRINSQLVAQQVAQQYATPPPPKKEKKEKPEKPEKERVDGERPDRNIPEGEPPSKETIEKDQPDKEKDREKEITPAITKKPNSKKTRPKTDSHQSPPSERNSIQSGKSTTKTKNSHISRPKLKNVDRSTAQQLAITVGNVTVIITDFKEKTRSSSTSSSTVTSSAGSEQQHQSSGSESMDKGSSRASTPKGDLSVGHDESF